MSLLSNFTSRTPRPLPVLLLLDVSGSMDGDKIEVLNGSVAEMLQALRDEDAGAGSIQLGVITFGGERAVEHLPLGPLDGVELSPLRANGRTPMGQAFELARRLIEDRDRLPSRSYRPTIALLSDGLPTDSGWDEALSDLVTSERASKASRFALGIGADADHEMLVRFSGDSRVYRAEEASQIRTFLQYVTMTVTQRTQSDDPDTPDTPDTPDKDTPIADLSWDPQDY